MTKVRPIINERDKEIMDKVFEILIRECHYRTYALKILRLVRYKIVDNYEQTKQGEL